MKKVAVYCRVSTDREDQTNSFEAQKRYFADYIQRQPDWVLSEIYADEGISGTSTQKRAQFNQMLNDAYAGQKYDVLVTKDVSRFSRNILDTITYTRELKALGIEVIFINDGIHTTDPTSELRLSLMGSMAQEESRKTSERVKWGQSRQMERGIAFGRSLLGYDVVNGKLSVEPKGAEIVRLIFQKYALEGKGTTTIARELREAGYQTPGGTSQWSSSYISKILKNEKYAGDLVQGKTCTPDYLTHKKAPNRHRENWVVLRNHHEPIVSRELWDAAQALLSRKNVHNRLSEGHSNRYVFSGKIKCAQCGASFVARKKYRKDGSYYKKWGCGTATTEGRRHIDSQGNVLGCDVGRMLREDAAMAMLREAIRSLRLSGISDHLTAIVRSAGGQGDGESRQRLEEERQKLLRRRDRVMDDYYDDVITQEEMRRLTARYDGELSAIREKLAGLEKQNDDPGAQIREKIQALLTCKTDSEVFYKTLLDTITVHKDGQIELKLQSLSQIWVYAFPESSGENIRIPQEDS